MQRYVARDCERLAFVIVSPYFLCNSFSFPMFHGFIHVISCRFFSTVPQIVKSLCQGPGGLSTRGSSFLTSTIKHPFKHLGLYLDGLSFTVAAHLGLFNALIRGYTACRLDHEASDHSCYAGESIRLSVDLGMTKTLPGHGICPPACVKARFGQLVSYCSQKVNTWSN